MPSNQRGSCNNCSAEFPYALIHNGFNDSAYAYCDTCGIVGFMSAWRSDIPQSANFRAHGPVSAQTESLLASCSCGGRFSITASPRCPLCHTELDAQAVALWIESQAAGAAKGWRWQRSWQGLYAVIINDHSAKLEWANGS